MLLLSGWCAMPGIAFAVAGCSFWTPLIGCADESSIADTHMPYCYIPNPVSCCARPGTVPSITATVDMDKQACVLQPSNAKVTLHHKANTVPLFLWKVKRKRLQNSPIEEHMSEGRSMGFGVGSDSCQGAHMVMHLPRQHNVAEVLLDLLAGLACTGTPLPEPAA